MNKSQVFIHIGYHKTGTTFLQRRVFPELPLNQVLTPWVDYVAESDAYDPAYFIEKLIRQGKFNRFEKTIISQEILSGRGDGNPIWDPFLIANRLKETFPAARILAVVREQKQYAYSLYTFRVIQRGLQRRSLSAWLAYVFEMGQGGLSQKLQYHRLLARYVELFGAEQVLILPYELLTLDGQAYLDAIQEFIGLEPALIYHPSKENVGIRNRHIILLNRLFNYPFDLTSNFLLTQSNISYQQYVRFAERYFLFKKKVIHPLLDKVLSSNSAVIELDSYWQQRFCEAFKNSNHVLGELMGTDLSQYGYIS